MLSDRLPSTQPDASHSLGSLPRLTTRCRARPSMRSPSRRAGTASAGEICGRSFPRPRQVESFNAWQRSCVCRRLSTPWGSRCQAVSRVLEASMSGSIGSKQSWTG